MIRSIWGTCDGAEILFQRSQAGLWETTVPARASGEYTVSLWAEDAAGNRSYFCTVLISYDITKLCCRFQVLDIGAEWSLDEVKAVFACQDVNACRSPDETQSNFRHEDVAAKLIRCDLCEE